MIVNRVESLEFVMAVQDEFGIALGSPSMVDQSIALVRLVEVA